MSGERQNPLENEASFRLLFNNNPLPMWVYDTRVLRILAVNQAAVRHYGYSREDFLAKTAAELRAPESKSSGPNPTEIPSGISVTVNETHLREDSSTIEVELTWSRLEFQHRDAVLVMAHDVTERRRAEDQVREQANLIDLAHDAILMRGTDERISYWNKGAERLYGWTSEEAVGQKTSELFSTVDAEAEAQAKALRHGEWSGELRHMTKAEKKIIVSSRWTLIKKPDGSPKGVLLINTDISEQKKLESQFLRTQRLESIGTLASGIAHDLNNILTPISMSIGLLRNSIQDESRLKLLNTVEVSAQRGAEIVRQVLTFARGVEGERVLLQPRHLIGELSKILAQTFPRNIRIKSRFTKDLWTVLGDATQLHQVLLNLCVNARDAMPEGGDLIVAGENVQLGTDCRSVNAEAKPGAYVILSVKDGGSGIPPEVVEKIWDPFFTTKEAGKGTGLGLSTVVGIVQNHGGFVNLETGIGEGTTFNIYIPAQTDGLLDETAAAEVVTPRGQGETILVVDDEPAIREAAASTLEANGYHVFTAEDGTDALALFFQRRQEISLVLSDISMELMDGVTLTRSLRRLEPTAKIVISTGQGTPEQRQELTELGVLAFLDKPYTGEKLLRTMHQALHGIPVAAVPTAALAGPKGDKAEDSITFLD